MILPKEYKDSISVEVINKKIDSVPENFALETIGGSVSDLKKYTRNIQGVLRNIVQYSFVTATNYKWSMHEIEINASAHIELGNSFKNPNDEISISATNWDDIIASIQIL